MFSEKFVYLLGGLFMLGNFYAAVRADDCNGTPSQAFGLCHDFQTLSNLAPRQTVLSLIRNHMSSDSRFRMAVQYMLSPQFKTTTKMIDNSAVYHSFLDKFSQAGVNTTDIDSVSKIFDCIIIPYIREAMGLKADLRSTNFPGKEAKTRSLDTLVQEISRLVPKPTLIKAIKDLLAESENFTEFYATIRDPGFRSQITQALTNSEIARPIKTLRHKRIDLCKLVEYGINLLNMGPVI